MKLTHTYLTLLLAFGLGSNSLANAAGNHDHSNHGHSHAGQGHANEDKLTNPHHTIKAPNGGRMLYTIEPHLEFLLLDDRYVQISAVNESGEVIPIEEQSARLIGGDRSSPVHVSFENVDSVLRSTTALPDLADIPLIIQIKSTPDSTTVREKFYLKTYMCSGCKLPEYACTCGH